MTEGSFEKKKDVIEKYLKMKETESSLCKYLKTKIYIIDFYFSKTNGVCIFLYREKLYEYPYQIIYYI